MSSLILELQRDALNPEIKVSELLLKALVVAKKLRISEVESWTNNELDGYSNSSDIPQYRLLAGEIKAWNPFHG